MVNALRMAVGFTLFGAMMGAITTLPTIIGLKVVQAVFPELKDDDGTETTVETSLEGVLKDAETMLKEVL